MAAHLHDTLPFLLNRIAAIITEEVNQTFRPAGLNVYSARVLILLYLEDASTVGELAEKAALDQSTLSHILRRLQSSGLLVKERPAHDSRTVVVTLTEEGRAAGEECWEAARSHDALLRKGLVKRDLDDLKALLLKIYDNAPAFRQLGRTPAVTLKSMRPTGNAQLQAKGKGKAVAAKKSVAKAPAKNTPAKTRTT